MPQINSVVDDINKDHIFQRLIKSFLHKNWFSLFSKKIFVGLFCITCFGTAINGKEIVLVYVLLHINCLYYTLQKNSVAYDASMYHLVLQWMIE